jgi:hypothetical protein
MAQPARFYNCSIGPTIRTLSASVEGVFCSAHCRKPCAFNSSIAHHDLERPPGTMVLGGLSASRAASS